MLSHEHDVTSISEGGAPTNSIHDATISHAALPPTLEDKLEEAVDQLCAPLIGAVPRAHRLAKHRALRGELDTLVAAHRELELEPEGAVEAAIAHFRRLHPAVYPQAVLSHNCEHAHDLTQNHTLQTTASPNHESRPAMLLSLGLLSSFYLTHICNGAERIREWLGLSEIALYRWELIGVPLFVGLVVGLLMRRRAVRGALLACGLLAGYAVLYPSLLCALSCTHLLPFESSDLYRHIVPDPISGYYGLTSWTLLTCAGAAIGAKLRTLKNK